MVDSELEQRIRRIVAIRRELQALYSQTQPGLTAAGVGIWIVSGGLTVAGLALAVRPADRRCSFPLPAWSCS